jgi:methionyl aminopeptidase
MMSTASSPIATASPLEATGEKFSIQPFLDTRRRVRSAVNEIAARVEVGMVEEEARVMARDLLHDQGMKKGWHHIIVRFGPNTTKDFMEPSEKGVVLGANDIFFVDIGPVYGDQEGDAGDTFVFGTDPDHHRAKADVKTIWNDVRERWFRQGSTGRDLYDYAEKVSAERGWRLNRDLSGHRLSEFPHSAHYDGAMAAVDFRPSPLLWVLEIAIIHPERKFGAFYEDLLLENQSFD